MRGPYLHKHCSGISLLEMLLVLMLVVAGITLSFNQYYQYTRTKNLTLIQQSVDQLLQAGSVYYYGTCNSITTGQVSLQTLQAVGGLPNEKTIYNPWGDKPNDPFEVWIISSDGSGSTTTPPYLIQVRAEFSELTTEEVGAVANLLGADTWAGGKSLSWTKLPSQVLKHLPMSVRSPGGWVPVMSGTYNGGQAINLNFQGMDGDLAKFSKDETTAGGGFTCPD